MTRMNTRFERIEKASDEWYTPKEVLEALGKFDLDPCAPIAPLWPTATVMYDKHMTDCLKNGKVVYGSIPLIHVRL